jgi:hypothetical protein
MKMSVECSRMFTFVALKMALSPICTLMTLPFFFFFYLPLMILYLTWGCAMMLTPLSS